MRIGIDISQVIYQTGVSVYTENLLRNLLQIDSENEYLLFGGSLRRIGQLQEFAKELRGNFQTKLTCIPPSLADFIGNTLHLPEIETLIGKVDVYHSSDWAQFASSARKVTTVHDLAPIFLPKFTNEKIRETHKRRLKWVVSEVDRVIVPSKSTKEGLVKIGVKSDRIKIIPEAPDAIFMPQPSQAIFGLKAKYKINGRYILGVGVGPRKNTQRLIDAYLKAKTSDLKLVLVGLPLDKTFHARGVIFTGHVPKQDLPAFYSGAEALAYPSLYEGFGLPILEAFACGCPVVTSNISSMPEVAGNAAILVDPHDTDSIAEGIKKSLRSRVGLSRKGLSRVKKFSWRKAAFDTLSIYKELA